MPWVQKALAWGAGPRAPQHLVLCAKARAALAGSYRVRLEDLQSVAPDVLEHRLILTFQAESEGLTGRGAGVAPARGRAHRRLTGGGAQRVGVDA